MSDTIKHECGIGLIRLLQPLEYYQEKYGSALWGLNKMYLLMEKQRNRGQDGAGLACVKLNMEPGKPYHARMRSIETSPWTDIYKNVRGIMDKLPADSPDQLLDSAFLKQHFPYAGEIYMGHLRYGTHGTNSVNACHPVIRTSNYVNRCLMLAGNFNLTNVDQLFQKLVELGQHPRHLTDTETMLERICHYLDKENELLEKKFLSNGYTEQETTQLIADEINIHSILAQSAQIWDGGYVMGGIIGNGDVFLARDPNGIRPCFFYHNDEFFVAASERAAISTVFDIDPENISELTQGHVISAKGTNNQISDSPFIELGELKSCSFERIYFSRGSDVDIYKERKELGKYIFPKVLESIDYDLENTVFSFIPNTAETSFLGMMDEVQSYLNEQKIKAIEALGENPDINQIRRIMSVQPRSEKVVHKDVKMRTFIADDSSRDDLVAHVYDVTRGIIHKGVDNLVCLDDSIVRGTTLQKSILNILSRLKPKKIVVVSSAPQIRYPDCYGIDMSKIHKLIAFQATIALLEERGMTHIIHDVYKQILTLKEEGKSHTRNVVKEIYDPFTEDEISAKITEIIAPEHISCHLDIIFQPLSNLSKAIPSHRGDWYFSGNYPTPGGNKIVNQAFINYYEGKNERAYQVNSF